MIRVKNKKITLKKEHREYISKELQGEDNNLREGVTLLNMRQDPNSIRRDNILVKKVIKEKYIPF